MPCSQTSIYDVAVQYSFHIIYHSVSTHERTHIQLQELAVCHTEYDGVKLLLRQMVLNLYAISSLYRLGIGPGVLDGNVR